MVRVLLHLQLYLFFAPIRSHRASIPIHDLGIMAFANGYTMDSTYNLDPLGWIYITIAILWTLLLLVGTTFIIARRNMPFLRIRNVPLAVSAVGILHIYWILCMVAYTFHGFYPCATEYWIMSVYLPMGIALFQASNTQLLHIAKVQRRYADDNASAKSLLKNRPANKSRFMEAFMTQNRMAKTMTLIAYAMAFQLVIALLIFLISRKFHHGFGFIDWTQEQWNDNCSIIVDQFNAVSCTAAERIQCRHGWQWIPSIIWQFFWAWFYAPYLLYRVRNIHDVHGWRMQTVVCCVAGLFGTPLWLSALYIPAMDKVNRYFIPALWFAPVIFLIEASLIFVPCYQILKNHRLQTETLDIISEWEAKTKGGSIGGTTLQSSARSRTSLAKSRANSRRGDLYTMQALESALRTNPQPLLMFAALKDFSGENISFLSAILDWKRAWDNSHSPMCAFLKRQTDPDGKLRARQFRKAVEIYATYVSVRHSDYSINLSHVHLRELEATFEHAAIALFGQLDDSDSNSATPFDAPSVSSRLFRRATSPVDDIEAGQDLASICTDRSTEHIVAVKDFFKKDTITQAHEMTSIDETLPPTIPIARGFGPHTFDRAEESIKYMVLTNTWPKFVNAGHAIANGQEKGLMSTFIGRLTGRNARVLS